MKISPIEVTYRSHMGSDLDVVNAARVSFAKEHTEFQDKDEGLIRYLAEHNHWSPFSHCFLSFHVKAPIFIARQLAKHTVGLAWNEVSRRYVDSEPEFYFPEYWRKRADNVKQGSSDEAIANYESLWDFDSLDEDVISSIEELNTLYKHMVNSGVAPEQARMILPQNTMTEWIWSGSLYAFARVVNLRSSSTAQREAGDVAQQLREALQALFPVSSKYLLKEQE